MRLRHLCLGALLTISSVAGVTPADMGSAHALTVTVGNYPFCDVNFLEVSTAQDEPTQGVIALSLGGASATSSDCVNSSNGSGIALTTGDSASSSMSAATLNGCYSFAGYLPAVGGGITHCDRAFLANISVFSDANGTNVGNTGNGYLSFSLFGDASGSWLAIAPLGNASSIGGMAVGCQSAYSTANVWWRWCSAWEAALTPAQRDLVYGALQGLASAGIVESQAAINFYNSSVSDVQTAGTAAFKPTDPCGGANDGEERETGIMPNLKWVCGNKNGVWDWRLVYII